MTHINAFAQDYRDKRALAQAAQADAEEALAALRAHPDYDPKDDPETKPDKEAKK